MILDDERQEGEWLKLRKKKTWTRNTERSLGSPENIAQWPMILKKKEKKKAFQRCYYFFSRTSLLVLMNGYLCCNVCVCSVIDSWLATSPSSRAFPFHWLLCQCVCITQTQIHKCYADTWGAGGWGQHRGSPIRPSRKKTQQNTHKQNSTTYALMHIEMQACMRNMHLIECLWEHKYVSVCGRLLCVC